MPWRAVRGRGGWQPRAILVIAVTWVLLWDQVTLGNVVNGFLVGIVVTQLFPLPSIQYAGRPHPLRVLVFLTHFLVDLVRSSVEVVLVVLRPGRMPPSSIIEVPLRTRSELYMTLVATIVGLTPGSSVVEARRGANVLYVHVLGVEDEAGLAEAKEEVLDIERRLVHAIGSPEEISRCQEVRA